MFSNCYLRLFYLLIQFFQSIAHTHTKIVLYHFLIFIHLIDHQCYLLSLLYLIIKIIFLHFDCHLRLDHSPFVKVCRKLPYYHFLKNCMLSEDLQILIHQLFNHIVFVCLDEVRVQVPCIFI